MATEYVTAPKWEFCGMARRSDTQYSVWRYADGQKWVYQIGKSTATPNAPPATTGGYHELAELLRLRSLELVEPFSGTTYRTACGRGRVTFNPDWDRSKPWASYIDGTAGLHFATPDAAVPHFAKNGMTLNIPQVPKMKGFIYQNWHAWESNGRVLLSDESVKKLRDFGTPDDCINWLFTNDQKDAARALNAHIKNDIPKA